MHRSSSYFPTFLICVSFWLIVVIVITSLILLAHLIVLFLQTYQTHLSLYVEVNELNHETAKRVILILYQITQLS